MQTCVSRSVYPRHRPTPDLIAVRSTLYTNRNRRRVLRRRPIRRGKNVRHTWARARPCMRVRIYLMCVHTHIHINQSRFISLARKSTAIRTRSLFFVVRRRLFVRAITRETMIDRWIASAGRNAFFIRNGQTHTNVILLLYYYCILCTFILPPPPPPPLPTTECVWAIVPATSRRSGLRCLVDRAALTFDTCLEHFVENSVLYLHLKRLFVCQ